MSTKAQLRFLDFFARAALGLSAMLALVSATTLVLLVLLTQEGPLQPAPGMYGLSRVVLAAPKIFTLATLIYGIAGITGAAGVLRGKKWGKGVLAALLALGIAWAIVAAVSEAVLAPVGSPAHGEGGRLLDGHGAMRWAVVTMSILLAGAQGWLLRRLWRSQPRGQRPGRPRRPPGST